MLALAACTTPTTRGPQLTQAEIDAESANQYAQAVKNPFPPIVEPVYTTKAMRDRLSKTAARIAPEATKLCYDMHGLIAGNACSFTLVLKGTKGVNAYADGQNVVVSAPMMVFASNDTHLALVISHEMAHNMMQHPQNMGSNVLMGSLLGTALDIAAATQGANTQGGFGQIGGHMANVTYSPAFEQEADYIALYILARAGYPIEEAPLFWRAFSQYDPQGIYARGTHPSNPARFVAMSKTIAEIRQKQQLKQLLIPNTLVKTS